MKVRMHSTGKCEAKGRNRKDGSNYGKVVKAVKEMDEGPKDVG